MDATPVTLGQELGGYATQVEQAAERICADALPRVGELPLGGTAVGTGINVPAGFAARRHRPAGEGHGAAAHRGRRPLRRQRVAATRWSRCPGLLRVVAVALVKIANDLRWMGSGPAAGLAEIRLPDLQPGSSIMPGKVNPVLPEAVLQVVAQVIGNDAAVAFAGGQGQLRAQRLPAGDRPQPARVDPAARRR